MSKIDPIFKLFDYACNRFYCIEYGEYPYTKTVKGLLLHYNDPIVILTEEGIYQFKQRDIHCIVPILPPKKISEEYKNLIETYLSARAAKE